MIHSSTQTTPQQGIRKKKKKKGKPKKPKQKKKKKTQKKIKKKKNRGFQLTLNKKGKISLQNKDGERMKLPPI